MTYTEGIVFTFLSFRKTGNSTENTVCVKKVPAAGQYLVPVSLMPHIPYKLVVWRIKYIMKCNGEFHHTQAGSEMTAENGNIIYDVLPQVLANQLKVRLIHFSQIRRISDSLEVFSGCYFHADRKVLQKAGLKI